MLEARPSSKRHQKIEPLSWEVAAQSPALKGMTSFLDISPEDVRRNNFDGFGPNRLGVSSDHVTSRVKKINPANVTTTAALTTAESVRTPEGVSTPGDETNSTITGDRPPQKLKLHTPRAVPSPDAQAFPVEEWTESSTQDETLPDRLTSPGFVSSPGYLSVPVDHKSGNLEHVHAVAIFHTLTPGRGKSKIRRCVLAQDGHSLGEEAIYQVLWRTGKPESSDPNGSRTNRMGAADIGYKVNMAKKNVRQNISRLFEKLAVEILEDFETINSQARLYRVFSYKQILERRRSAGLEYILRNKGVVFCTRDGAELVSSPAYVSSPGDQSAIRPAPPKKRKVHSALTAQQQPQIAATSLPVQATDQTDLETVSTALNRYWSVDQAAAVQLLRACRTVRPDATANEVAFFVQEKLEVARRGRTINNPTGLILATVPQSFEGAAFLQFRERTARRATIASEEAARRAQQEAEMTAWLSKDRERYESIVNDPGKSEKERDDAEKRLREIAAWADSA